MVLYNRFPPSGQLYMHSIVIRSYDITKATEGTGIPWGAVPCLLARWLPVVLREYTAARGDCAF